MKFMKNCQVGSGLQIFHIRILLVLVSAAGYNLLDYLALDLVV